ncbi:MAG: hypothetical protein Q4G25_03945 [Paracoccus sp. (in: a-proteobacteria)]|nr:hypothetical protein [Paracoccus sp. (in: a-proteobacteria)]
MKLSDMFSTLARSAGEFETRLAKWQEDIKERSGDLKENARKWREQAAARQAELGEQIKGFFDDADDKVKAQWESARSEWDSEAEKLRARGTELRRQAEQMQVEDMADWSEAYAAHMVAYARQVQEEAGNAVAAATEARARADAAKTAQG